MEYTQQQLQEFKNQYALRRKRQLTMTVPLVVLAVLFALADKATGLVLGTIPISVFGPVVLIAVIGALIFSLKNWRYPACNKYLGKSMNPSFCSKCGVALR